jgi:hypothetical protein
MCVFVCFLLPGEVERVESDNIRASHRGEQLDSGGKRAEYLRCREGNMHEKDNADIHIHSLCTIAKKFG